MRFSFVLVCVRVCVCVLSASNALVFSAHLQIQQSQTQIRTTHTRTHKRINEYMWLYGEKLHVLFAFDFGLCSYFGLLRGLFYIHFITRP